MGPPFGAVHHIIDIASARRLAASSHKSAGVAAKHGVLGLTKTFALEFAAAASPATPSVPDYVQAPLVEAQIPDGMKAQGMDRETVIRVDMLDTRHDGRFVRVEQIGRDDPVAPIGGGQRIDHRLIHVDGGWTARSFCTFTRRLRT